MIHDKFYGSWEQPTSIFKQDLQFVATVKIRIEKSGHISSVALIRSSGNPVMDKSVLDAAARVKQIDPLPAELGDRYEVNINFELD